MQPSSDKCICARTHTQCKQQQEEQSHAHAHGRTWTCSRTAAHAYTYTRTRAHARTRARTHKRSHEVNTRDRYTRPLEHVDRYVCEGTNDRGFVKMHVRKGTDEILGCTIVSENAGDMISEVTTCIQHGIGAAKLAGVIHPYPTHQEAVRQVGPCMHLQVPRTRTHTHTHTHTNAPTRTHIHTDKDTHTHAHSHKISSALRAFRSTAGCADTVCGAVQPTLQDGCSQTRSDDTHERARE